VPILDRAWWLRHAANVLRAGSAQPLIAHLDSALPRARQRPLQVVQAGVDFICAAIGAIALCAAETRIDRHAPGARQSAVQVSSYQRTVNVPPTRVGVRVGATRTVLAVAA
jgi:hypothetical protein